MKLHDLLARALHYAIEDRMALFHAYGGEGETADEARRDADRFRALHERLKITPVHKIHQMLGDTVENLTLAEIKKRVSAEANTSLGLSAHDKKI